MTMIHVARKIALVTGANGTPGFEELATQFGIPHV